MAPDFYGFQFKVSGVDIVNVSNDVLVTQIGSEFIIGFSFTNDIYIGINESSTKHH